MIEKQRRDEKRGLNKWIFDPLQIVGLRAGSLENFRS